MMSSAVCKMQIMFFCLLQVWVNPRTPAGPSCHGDTGPFREGSSWRNTLGIPHPSPPSPPLLNPPKSHTELSRSALLSAASAPPVRASVSFLISQQTSSHYTEELSAEALSHFFISVIASQQASGSPSQHPLTLAMVGGWADGKPLRYWWGLMAAMLGELVRFPPLSNSVQHERWIQFNILFLLD